MGNKQQLQLNNETLDSILSNVLGLPAQVDPLSDTDLIPSNIREGIDIWGVIGTVVEGRAGIDFGEVTLASTAETVTVRHNLGVVPSWVALVPKVLSRSSNTTTENINGTVLYHSSYGDNTLADKNNTLSTTKITFAAYKSSFKFKATDYYWIAIA